MGLIILPPSETPKGDRDFVAEEMRDWARKWLGARASVGFGRGLIKSPILGAPATAGPPVVEIRCFTDDNHTWEAPQREEVSPSILLARGGSFAEASARAERAIRNGAIRGLTFVDWTAADKKADA